MCVFVCLLGFFFIYSYRYLNFISEACFTKVCKLRTLFVWKSHFCCKYMSTILNFHTNLCEMGSLLCLLIHDDDFDM